MPIYSEAALMRRHVMDDVLEHVAVLKKLVCSIHIQIPCVRAYTANNTNAMTMTARTMAIMRKVEIESFGFFLG